MSTAQAAPPSPQQLSASRVAAWAWSAMLGAMLLVGGGCLMDGSDGSADRIMPAKVLQKDFAEDEAWRAKVKKDSFPPAGPDGL